MLHVDSSRVGTFQAINCEEKLEDFGSEDYMNHMGELRFVISETCLSCDHEALLVAPKDLDAQNPILAHFTPHNMSNEEARDF